MHSTLIKNGLKQAKSIDARRRRYILLFVSYITSAVMFIYAIKNFGVANISLISGLFITASAFLSNIVYFHYSKNLNLACIIQAILASLFVLGLVYLGGFNNTALYWVFPFPAILFGLLGVRNALIGSAILVSALAIMLFVPDLILANYKESEQSRFITSLIIVVLVSWINDFFREKSHQEMFLLQHNKELQANTDPLTELVNRRFIDASLRNDFKLHPEQFFPLSIITCDLDHFKQLNDQFGHQAGDIVLKQVAELFRTQLRQQDIACRTGGEEFLLFLPKTIKADAFKVAEKIREKISKQSIINNETDYKITASFGIADCYNHLQVDTAIALADQQLYQSKRNGRNQIS
ncbi:GGDEF domain-containing protein [Rheinheimera sp. MMS21-TC3]|uniref:GGDEF domain-containing protein n=1 Tax=Rheinheimera sp. MMS21-TC3 TaxID=3072790 RepID=UPI0028C42855|nr:GGDEF domain-containing protein [Rheinheimera sp. MMS21-TC3]WNO59691.1 GGDEF domain-containing protein [Rheinheimera sp. MMS21-TC3]